MARLATMASPNTGLMEAICLVAAKISSPEVDLQIEAAVEEELLTAWLIT